MTFDQLIYFSEVYRQRSINAASLNCHIAHQSLSTSIQQLERELSTTLFIRTNKGLLPTVEGDLFYQSAQKIINELNIVKYKINPPTKPQNCSIMLSYSLSPAVSSGLFNILTDLFPGIFFDISFLSLASFNMLPHKNYPDILFTFVASNERPTIESLNFPNNYNINYLTSAPYCLSFWLSKASPLAKYTELSPAQLQDASLVYPRHQTDMESAISFFTSFNISPTSIYFAETEEITARIIYQKNYIASDLNKSNFSVLLHPNFSHNPNLVLKQASNDFPKVHFVLIYKESASAFYPIIADYLTNTFFS